MCRVSVCFVLEKGKLDVLHLEASWLTWKSSLGTWACLGLRTSPGSLNDACLNATLADCLLFEDALGKVC